MSRLHLNPKHVRIAALVAVVLTFTACQQRMASPPQYRPLMESDFFDDHRSSRPLEEGVIHRGQILDDDPLTSGLTALGKQIQTVQILNDDGTPKEIEDRAPASRTTRRTSSPSSRSR